MAELQQRVGDGCELIFNTPGIFESAQRAVWIHKDNTLSVSYNLPLSKQ
jgi:hypothetical protein